MRLSAANPCLLGGVLRRAACRRVGRQSSPWPWWPGTSSSRARAPVPTRSRARPSL